MTREEFSRYVETHYDALTRFVNSRLHNSQDSEDLVQQTIVKLLPNCGDIDAASPDGYFFTALRTGLIDFWRKRGRRPSECELSEQMDHPDETVYLLPADPGAEGALKRAMEQAVENLTPREKKALVACWHAFGDRLEALEELGLDPELDSKDKKAKQERYKAYDGPLFHAKRKLSEALSAHWELVSEVGSARVWELVNEVIGG
jgi:RNA polymerase sigma factor (sigma-70 family)